VITGGGLRIAIRRAGSPPPRVCHKTMPPPTHPQHTQHSHHTPSHNKNSTLPSTSAALSRPSYPRSALKTRPSATSPPSTRATPCTRA
jgi:hypothetical protein